MTRGKIIAYTVEPLRPVLTTRRHNELTGELTIKPQIADFWEFLNLPFLIQLQVVAFVFLKKRGLIENQYRRWEESSIQFREFNTESIIKTITEHVISYINIFGEEPATILVGQDIHQQLFSSPQIQYQIEYQHKRSHQISVAGIRVVLVRHMRGFVLLPDVSSDNLL